MKGKIIKVISGVKLITYVIEMGEEGTVKTNIVRTFKNAVNWIDLEPGDKVKNLIWKSESDEIIDGDSPVERE